MSGLDEELTLDQLARRLFPKFDHDDRSELNIAVWEQIKEHVLEAVSDGLDGNYARRLVERDKRA